MYHSISQTYTELIQVALSRINHSKSYGDELRGLVYSLAVVIFDPVTIPRAMETISNCEMWRFKSIKYMISAKEN